MIRKTLKEVHMNIALVQAEATTDKTANLQNAVSLIAQAAAEGASLVVFPEMYMALPEGNNSLAPQAERLDGPFVSTLSQSARQHDVTVICGIWEQAPDSSRVFNTAVVVLPNGKIAGSYRKLHLFDALSVRESARMLPGGEHPPVLDLAGMRVGLAICYDLRFPELFRNLVERGADLIVVPSAWYAGPHKEDHWLTLLRARAIENTVYVAGVNLIGSAFAGRTSLIDPFGVITATATEGVDIVYGTLTGARITQVRQKLPALSHCRKDLYPTGTPKVKAGV
jgi:apolipoprotein N-acyltransferase